MKMKSHMDKNDWLDAEDDSQGPSKTLVNENEEVENEKSSYSSMHKRRTRHNNNEEDRTVENQEFMEVRRSSRQKKSSEHFKEYVMLTYAEAISGQDRQRWLGAINEEKKSLKENDTWEIINSKKLKKEKPLSGKWIFKIKQDGKYKARLVIRGCEQEPGISYQETFSPVISTSALRVLFAVGAIKNYVIVIFDIKTAFLYGEVEEDVYMYPPEGYDCKGKVFKLKKALYGLKQASLRWNIRFTNFLKEKDFKPLISE